MRSCHDLRRSNSAWWPNVNAGKESGVLRGATTTLSSANETFALCGDVHRSSVASTLSATEWYAFAMSTSLPTTGARSLICLSLSALDPQPDGHGTCRRFLIASFLSRSYLNPLGRPDLRTSMLHPVCFGMPDPASLRIATRASSSGNEMRGARLQIVWMTLLMPSISCTSILIFSVTNRIAAYRGVVLVPVSAPSAMSE